MASGLLSGDSSTTASRFIEETEPITPTTIPPTHPESPKLATTTSTTFTSITATTTTLPLTTILTPPSSCFGITLLDSEAYMPAMGFWSDCGLAAGASHSTYYFFSPGVCPSGFTSACSIDRIRICPSDFTSDCSIDRTVRAWDGQFTLGPGESGHRCCPR